MRIIIAQALIFALFAPLAHADSGMKTYVYTSAATHSGSIDLHLDYYSQGGACDALRPTLLYIHGGGFVDGDRTAESEYSDVFLEAGFNYASVDYRKVHDDPAPKNAYLKFAKKIEKRAEGGAAIEHPDVIFAAASAMEDVFSDKPDGLSADH